MRNDSPMLKLAVFLIVVMILCMACLDKEENQLACILAAAIVGCVYMVCESRVSNAKQMMMTLETVVKEKTKPPEGEAE